MDQASAAARQRHGRTGRRASASAGFTLVEVIISMAVALIVFVAIYGAVAMNLSLVQMCRENETATQILTEKLETIRLYNWEQINTEGFVPGTFTVALDPAHSTGQSYFTGTVCIARAPITEAYGNNMRLVTVTLDWVSGSRPQTRSMSTFVTRHGLQKYIIR